MSGQASRALGGHPVTPDGLEAFLRNRPGATSRDLRSGMSAAQERALNDAIDQLAWERRIVVVRFNGNAPGLRVEFFYFPSAWGRIEVVAPDGVSHAFVHDPLGTWQAAMDRAISADRD